MQHGLTAKRLVIPVFLPQAGCPGRCSPTRSPAPLRSSTARRTWLHVHARPAAASTASSDDWAPSTTVRTPAAASRADTSGSTSAGWVETRTACTRRSARYSAASAR